MCGGGGSVGCAKVGDTVFLFHDGLFGSNGTGSFRGTDNFNVSYGVDNRRNVISKVLLIAIISVVVLIALMCT